MNTLHRMNPAEDRYNFVTLDFEFTMVDRTSIVLISGAIVNSETGGKTIVFTKKWAERTFDLF